jgi:putative nucleotidyltransferase with HDIG domain
MFGSGGLVELWKHSQAVATMAQNLAMRCGADPEAAWTAGLLHDVGRIVFEKAPAPVVREEKAFVAAGFPLAYAESMIYGKDHAALGSDLLEMWGVPQEIVESVAFHHRPEATDSLLSGILYFAEDAAEGGQSGDPSREMRLSSAAALTGLERAAQFTDRHAALHAVNTRSAAGETV